MMRAHSGNGVADAFRPFAAGKMMRTRGKRDSVPAKESVRLLTCAHDLDVRKRTRP
ncbi:MAG: hypothetical protein WCH85_07655 [Methanomicrobiales archaeon]